MRRAWLAVLAAATAALAAPLNMTALQRGAAAAVARAGSAALSSKSPAPTPRPTTRAPTAAPTASLGDHVQTITHFKVLGERGSGASWVRRLVAENLPGLDHLGFDVPTRGAEDCRLGLLRARALTPPTQG
jgi:hypothetical protein